MDRTTVLIILLGLAACAALVVTPILIFGWLRRRHPRVHNVISYFLAAAFVWMIGTSLLFPFVNALNRNNQDDNLIVSSLCAAVLVGAALLFIYRKRVTAWARKHLALSFLPRIIAAGLLAFAPFSWPEDFYLLLRWFVFGAAILVAVVAIRHRQFFWVWLFAMLALLFNPVKLFHFTHEEVWHTADVASAALFLLSCLFVSEKRLPSVPAVVTDAA